METQAAENLFREIVAGMDFKEGIPHDTMRDLLSLALVTSGADGSTDHEKWPSFSTVNLPLAKGEDRNSRQYTNRNNEFRRMVWPWWMAEHMMKSRYFYEVWKKEYETTARNPFK